MVNRRIVRSLVAGCFALVTTCAQAVVITDCCDWASGWTFGSSGDNGGTASAVVENSGGNPGARLNVTTVTTTASAIAFGLAVLSNVSVSASPSGTPFTLQLDELSAAG